MCRRYHGLSVGAQDKSVFEIAPEVRRTCMPDASEQEDRTKQEMSSDGEPPSYQSKGTGASTMVGRQGLPENDHEALIAMAHTFIIA